MAQPTKQATRPKTSTSSASNRTRPSQTKRGGTARPFSMPLERENIIYILVGMAVVSLGYVLMGSGEALGFVPLNISPFVLVLGYLIVIPMGIMYGARRKKVPQTLAEANEFKA